MQSLRKRPEPTIPGLFTRPSAAPPRRSLPPRGPWAGAQSPLPAAAAQGAAPRCPPADGRPGRADTAPVRLPADAHGERTVIDGLQQPQLQPPPVTRDRCWNFSVLVLIGSPAEYFIHFLHPSVVFDAVRSREAKILKRRAFFN